MTTRLFSFIGGESGPWAVRRQLAVVGDPLPPVRRVEVVAGDRALSHCSWLLRGITSNERYVERAERDQLVAKQENVGRTEATYAALIPIRKSAAWWSLTQDQRRMVFEEQSHHIRVGLKYLPAVARRLHHCRDISDSEPFDFLTWFEYAPGYEQAFDDLVSELRASPEWSYVEREVDIRLVRDEA
jgi:chlorite dismutase